MKKRDIVSTHRRAKRSLTCRGDWAAHVYALLAWFHHETPPSPVANFRAWLLGVMLSMQKRFGSASETTALWEISQRLGAKFYFVAPAGLAFGKPLLFANDQLWDGERTANAATSSSA